MSLIGFIRNFMRTHQAISPQNHHPDVNQRFEMSLMCGCGRKLRSLPILDNVVVKIMMVSFRVNEVEIIK